MIMAMEIQNEGHVERMGLVEGSRERFSFSSVLTKAAPSHCLIVVLELYWTVFIRSLGLVKIFGPLDEET